MFITVIFNTKFRCTLIAMNFQTKNVVSVLYAKYGDYGMCFINAHFQNCQLYIVYFTSRLK